MKPAAPANGVGVRVTRAMVIRLSQICLGLDGHVWSATNFWKSPEMPQVTFVPLTTYTATRNRLPGKPVNVVLYFPTTGVVPAVNSAWWAAIVVDEAYPAAAPVEA